MSTRCTPSRTVRPPNGTGPFVSMSPAENQVKQIRWIFSVNLSEEENDETIGTNRTTPTAAMEPRVSLSAACISGTT